MAENERNLLTVSVGYGSEFDFGINGSVSDLSYEKMNEFRAMIIVAIGTMEDMWRRGQAEKNPAVKSINE